ncbi:maleylpyruvate isomerase N-terminal domain-containing protein [Streptomyces sp. NPDC005209]|uniref:maleylpyruvate isomerase N-terminal domain-containing protein n=1 Tax=Streptomyces sp. NPDC005209 TaxID=3156715 RepID=UPI0033B44532
MRLNDAQTVAFRAAVAFVPSHDVQVPACPEWTLSDLVQHLSGVHRRHVTGSSRGFGREFAQAALERGDRAVARNTDSLADLPAAHGEAISPRRARRLRHRPVRACPTSMLAGPPPEPRTVLPGCG